MELTFNFKVLAELAGAHVLVVNMEIAGKIRDLLRDLVGVNE